MIVFAEEKDICGLLALQMAILITFPKAVFSSAFHALSHLGLVIAEPVAELLDLSS